ncbi:hypothetical protein B0H10DRAFT_1963823 [Mycena sp. CBHHK59/15]|nr:hypothetical protein B0H10DRAFT_1963823 [Mycena sp. CBHHK59/15]
MNWWVLDGAGCGSLNSAILFLSTKVEAKLSSSEIILSYLRKTTFHTQGHSMGSKYACEREVEQQNSMLEPTVTKNAGARRGLEGEDNEGDGDGEGEGETLRQRRGPKWKSGVQDVAVTSSSEANIEDQDRDLRSPTAADTQTLFVPMTRTSVTGERQNMKEQNGDLAAAASAAVLHRAILRSELSPRSPRVAKKAFRAQATKAGLSYWAAVNASKELQASRKICTASSRSLRVLYDGIQAEWMESSGTETPESFVCATEVDDGLAPSRADIIDGAMEVALVVFGCWVSSPEIIGNHVTEVLSVDRYA